MIDEHFCARFHVLGTEVGGGDTRRFEATVIIPIALDEWRGLEATHPERGEALYRAAFELARPHLAGVPTSVQFFKVLRIVVDTVIGRISTMQEMSNHSPTYWLAGEGPLDAEGLAKRFPRATHAIDHLKATGGRKILVDGFLHDFGPHDLRVDWEEARRPAEPSHRLLTVEGGFHPSIGELGLESRGDL